MARSLAVRAAVPGDAAAIGQAHATAWLAAYDHIFEWDFLLAAASGRRVGWESRLASLLVRPNLFLVGELDDRVVAFAFSQPIEPTIAELLGFYCHPRAWGSGIAALLMERTIASFVAQCDEVLLWTFRDAARARRFYENAGYEVTGAERAETLTDWSSGRSCERPAVQYRRRLRP